MLTVGACDRHWLRGERVTAAAPNQTWMTSADCAASSPSGPPWTSNERVSGNKRHRRGVRSVAALHIRCSVMNDEQTLLEQLNSVCASLAFRNSKSRLSFSICSPYPYPNPSTHIHNPSNRRLRRLNAIPLLRVEKGFCHLGNDVYMLCEPQQYYIQASLSLAIMSTAVSIESGKMGEKKMQ